MSHAPRPIRRPSTTAPLEGVDRPGVGRARGHGVEMSVPHEARAPVAADRRDHARAAGLATDGARSGAQPEEHPVATSAASSSVAPGFSDRARDQGLGERQHLVGVHGRGGGVCVVGHRAGRYPKAPTCAAALRTMEPMPDLARALAPALDPAPSPRPGPGDRLAAVLALVAGADEPELVFTERAAMLSRHAGEISFPGGLQDPDDADLAATALRETREEIGVGVACRRGARRAAAGPYVRERDPRDAVRRRRAGASGARRERRGDRARRAVAAPAASPRSRRSGCFERRTA